MTTGSKYAFVAWLIVWTWLPVGALAQRTEFEATPEVSRPIVTLREAREVLRQRNYDLQITRRAVERARLVQDVAMGTLLPRVDIQGSYTLRDEEVLFEMPNLYAPLSPYLESIYDSDPDLQEYFEEHPDEDARVYAQAESEPNVIMRRHTFAGSLVVTQILANFRAFAGLDIADIAVLQAENSEEQAEFQLMGALNQMYFGAVGLKRFVEVSQRNVEMAELTHQRARIAFEEDVGSQFEVNRTEVALSQARRDLESAQLSYRLAVSALAVLLDVPSDFDVEMPPEVIPPVDYRSLIDTALENRPEVEGYDLAVEHGQRYIDENQAGWWPTLMAQGILNLQQASTFGGDELSWMVIVTASWNLYDGGLRSTETENRELALVQSELSRDRGLARIGAEIEQAWLSMESQARQVESARAEVALANDNVELTRTAWELGAATELEVEYAREALFLSELGLAASEVQLQSQVYELYRLAGDLR